MNRRRHLLSLLIQLHHLVIIRRVHILEIGLILETSFLFPLFLMELWLISLFSCSFSFVNRLFFETSPPPSLMMMLWQIGLAVHIVGGLIIRFIARIHSSVNFN